MDAATVPFDGTDPLVVFFAWTITLLARNVGDYVGRDISPWAPFLAVVIATALRAGVDAVRGAPLNASTIARAVAAGGVAVLVHSQGREWVKLLPKGPPESDPPTHVS